MVYEMNILDGAHNKSSSLIRYLCTYPTMQGRGCATKVMTMVFQQDIALNQSSYAVTKLPFFLPPKLFKT